MKFKFTNEPKIYDVKDVNRVIINILFPTKSSNADVINRTLLLRMLSNYNKDYKDPNTFYNKTDSLYIINYSVNTIKYLEVTYIKFSLALPKEGLIDDYSFKDALKFFYDCIYKVNAENGEFNKESFDNELRFIYEREKDFPKSIYEYTSDEYYKFIDKEERLGVSHDTYMKLLDKANSKDVYSYYEKNVLNNNYFVYVFGNISDKDKFTKEFKKVFNKEHIEFRLEAKFTDYFKYNGYKEKKEKTKYKQSVLYLNYCGDGATEKDFIYYYAIFNILNSRENALIYNALRTNNNIVYSAKVRSTRIHGLLDVVVYFNDYDYKKIIEIVNETINSLRDEKVFNECKEKLVKAFEYDLLYKEDEPFGDILEKIETQISDEILFKDKIEMIKKIDHKSLVKALDKIKLSRAYLFESGDRNV